MLHRVVNVKYLENAVLEVTFQDGKVKAYDMKRLFGRYPQLRALTDYQMFRSGRLTAYGIIWNDELDIDTDTIYECGDDVGEAKVAASYMIAYAVTSARRAAGLSQAQLAAKVGIDQADISKIECGIANPSINTLERLANGMGMELDIQLKPDRVPSYPHFCY